MEIYLTVTNKSLSSKELPMPYEILTVLTSATLLSVGVFGTDLNISSVSRTLKRANFWNAL